MITIIFIELLLFGGNLPKLSTSFMYPWLTLTEAPAWWLGSPIRKPQKLLDWAGNLLGRS